MRKMLVDCDAPRHNPQIDFLLFDCPAHVCPVCVAAIFRWQGAACGFSAKNDFNVSKPLVIGSGGKTVAEF